MKIKAEIDGVEQEFEVLRMKHDEVRKNGPATHALDNSEIKPANQVITTDPVYLRLIRPRHTFGPEDGPKVVFEETGEHRRVKPGEWFVRSGALNYSNAQINQSIHEHPILRPVAIE